MGTPLHCNQHAYQPGKSCETPLHHLLSRIEYCVGVKEMALCVFLEFEGASDNTSFNTMGHVSVIPILSSFGWVGAMLCSRRLLESILNEIIEITPTRVCLQSSPLLWNPVVGDLLNDLTQAYLYTQTMLMTYSWFFRVNTATL